jgi:hypothetical protein
MRFQSSQYSRRLDLRLFLSARIIRLFRYAPHGAQGALDIHPNVKLAVRRRIKE